MKYTKPFWGMGHYYSNPFEMLECRGLVKKTLPISLKSKKVVFFPFSHELHFKGVDINSFYESIDKKRIARTPEDADVLINIEIKHVHDPYMVEVYTYCFDFYDLKNKKNNVYSYRMPVTNSNSLACRVGGKRSFVRTMVTLKSAVDLMKKVIER